MVFQDWTLTGGLGKAVLLLLMTGWKDWGSGL